MNHFATDFEGKAIEIKPRKYHPSYEHDFNKKEKTIKEPNIDYRKPLTQEISSGIRQNNLIERKTRYLDLYYLLF